MVMPESKYSIGGQAAKRTSCLFHYKVKFFQRQAEYFLVSQSEITKRDLNPQLDCKFVSIKRLMVVYFFSGTGSFAPFDMVTVNRSILLTHSGLMRKPA